MFPVHVPCYLQLQTHIRIYRPFLVLIGLTWRRRTRLMACSRTSSHPFEGLLRWLDVFTNDVGNVLAIPGYINNAQLTCIMCGTTVFFLSSLTVLHYTTSRLLHGPRTPATTLYTLTLGCLIYIDQVPGFFRCFFCMFVSEMLQKYVSSWKCLPAVTLVPVHRWRARSVDASVLVAVIKMGPNSLRC